AGSERASRDATHEAEDDFILPWRPAVHPNQPLDCDIKASLLARLADHPLPRGLTRLHRTPRLAPPITVAAMRQYPPSCGVQDGGKAPDGELHAPFISSPRTSLRTSPGPSHALSTAAILLRRQRPDHLPVTPPWWRPTRCGYYNSQLQRRITCIMRICPMRG